MPSLALLPVLGLALGVVLAGPAAASPAPGPASAQALPTVLPSEEGEQEPAPAADEPEPEPEEPPAAEPTRAITPSPTPQVQRAPTPRRTVPERIVLRTTPPLAPVPSRTPRPTATRSVQPVLTGFVPPGPSTATPATVTPEPVAERRGPGLAGDPLGLLPYAVGGAVLLGLAGVAGLYLTRE